MSFELRLKKLRGSGGYVMAKITDDQQQKGNLGGPDLFLAPIGRLDSDKILKYFCNTCEKDYEGSPKIEFENPNEEVADNLVLIEKGQYVCTNCGSTLAEYREFKKSNELSDVGVAKSLSPNLDTSIQPPPVDESPLIMPDFEQINIPQTSVSEILTRPVDSTFSSIVGMAVYDEDAKRIGTAKQVGVDSSQSVVLIITKNDGNDVIIPWNNIKKVGEIVLLGSSESAIGASQGQFGQIGKCPGCGFVNKAGSKFCEQCGTKL